MASLDEETKTKYFYYKSKDSDIIYEVPYEVVHLSKIFSLMIEQHKDIERVKENAVVLDLVYISHVETSGQFTINTDQKLKYIDKYFKNWAGKSNDANYVKETCIKTSDIKNILKPVDLDLINEFINENILLIKEGKRPDYTGFSEEDFEEDENYKRAIKLQLLNELLHQTEFLDIESLIRKIMAYIGAIIWEVSLVDMHKINTKLNLSDNTSDVVGDGSSVDYKN